jgi:hypothetical protein
MSGGYSSQKSTMSGRAIKLPSTQPAESNRFNARLKKEKKMNFIKRKLRNWLMDEPYNDMATISVRDEQDISDHENSINFTVINAAGGRIVQVRYYDRKADRHSNKLHIITPEEDLAEALAHILTIETISR